jgi:hypothetical protein
MGKESQVEIPVGSGNFYRYEYDESSGKTQYRGPVGDAPAIKEQEFFDLHLQPEVGRFEAFLGRGATGTDLFALYKTKKQREKIMAMIRDASVSRASSPTSIDADEEYDTIIGRPIIKDGKPEWEDGALTNAYKFGYMVIIDDYHSMDPHVMNIIRGIAKDEEFFVNGEMMRRHPGFQMVCLSDSWRVFQEDAAAFPEMFNFREMK